MQLSKFNSIYDNYSNYLILTASYFHLFRIQYWKYPEHAQVEKYFIPTIIARIEKQVVSARRKIYISNKQLGFQVQRCSVKCYFTVKTMVSSRTIKYDERLHIEYNSKHNCTKGIVNKDYFIHYDNIRRKISFVVFPCTRCNFFAFSTRPELSCCIPYFTNHFTYA